MLLLRLAFASFFAFSASAFSAEPSDAGATPERIADAVRQHHVVTFVYQGRARTVEPHTCGIATNTHEAVLHGYQTDGDSASGTPPGWRTFTVAKITGFVVTEKSFTAPRADYAAGRPHLDPVWAEVAAKAP